MGDFPANVWSYLVDAAKRVQPPETHHQRGAFATLLGCLAALHFPAQAAEVTDDEAVIQLQEPTAPLRWFQLSDWYKPTLYGEEGNINQLVFRTVLPFTINDTLFITRFTQQCTVSATSGKTGCLDPELLLIRVFSEVWGRWGIGVDIQPPTGAESLTSHKWSVGPVLGFATSSAAPVQYGLYVRSYWSVSGKNSAKDVGVVNLQPVCSVKLGHGHALSLGQTQFVYDTVASHWMSLQVGLNYSSVFRFFGRRWTPSAELDHDFENRKGNAMWTARLGLTMFEPGP